ncbi:biotin-independent malonate decarboxylase subunit beta [Brevibacillus fluminis]|uniref:Biotin-independent malonate decarboxylase subunit beta n=1 Tax=Brevibacillus fluminis TaxID=511487 RepID=A0A3M8DNW5_9BACL|nr:biotin-independent malonate decarboxylase subunit beta [Brevibacillus fluminis]RNB89796.1 biotin-independent malonate decarboxylase subunit beta [Brevibacillus fluminis]
MRETRDMSFVELNARDRAKAILDAGTFRELLGPFDRMESPHLAPQGIVPQSDDGVVVGRGLIAGVPAVVISIEGAFQGGGIGEVSGAKIAGALELALVDWKKGIPTRPVVLFDTGGVRLQEANYGLLSIAEIGAAVVALRQHTPVVGVIPGKIGCFGGMGITAALFSHLLMTKEGRFGLNGPEVIEQEAGIEEFDASDRMLIWQTIGGAQRQATGFVDEMVEDSEAVIRARVQAAFEKGIPVTHRTQEVERYTALLRSIDPQTSLNPDGFRELWAKALEGELATKPQATRTAVAGDVVNSRGRTWFQALAGHAGKDSPNASVLTADTQLDDQRVRYIAVVPNPHARFPRASEGEVGLEEGWAIARAVRQAIAEDQGKEQRAIVAIVDVPSQAYGYREELLGIHYALAAAADAYASARMAGHPVIGLLVGNAISGAFLAHGFQANRLLALDDPGVSVQAMSKQSASRITRRTIDELEEATKKVPAMAYDIRSFASLGALYELIEGINAEEPTAADIRTIQAKLREAIADASNGPRDLSSRFTTEAAIAGGRSASIAVRSKLAAQWD